MSSKQYEKTLRHGMKHRVASKIFSILAIIFGILLILAGSMTIAGSVVASQWLKDLPSWSDIEDYGETGITSIYANDGTTKLAEIKLANRIKVPSESISDNMKKAIVSVEDERFYEHGAIDLSGIMRAFISNATGGATQGASTITQQLVRNTVLLDEMNDISIKRKIREMYVAIQLEKDHSKDDILTMYLNIVNFGDGDYGVEAASRDYFGKSANELTLSEASLLAGIPNSPTQYNPRTNYDDAMKRREHVLDRMLENGNITQEEHDTALSDKPKIVKKKKNAGVSNIAPYFVDYVKQLLEDDSSYNIDSKKNGGYSIITSLDVKDQKAANKSVKSVLAGSDLDGSISSIDPSNGYIVAMVGGKNYKKDNYNLSTQMSRQAGSTFKTFTMIAAMQKGVSPDERIDATAPAKIGNWTVENSDGEHFYGKMTIRKAYQYSANTVFARLAHAIGSQSIIDTAHAMGIKSSLSNVESITLGTQGVNTLEMASAYATIASGGIYHEPIAITRIIDDDGNAVYENDGSNGIRVIDEAIAYEATKVMESVVDGGTGRNAALNDGRQCAGKTGTSEHGRDLWFVGFTPQLSCAVWTGHRKDHGTSLYGGTTSTPIFKKYMDAALAGTEKKDFEKIDTSGIVYKTDWEF